MHWILIIWLTGYPGAGLHSIEMNTKGHCLKAGIELKKSVPFDTTFMCVEK